MTVAIFKCLKAIGVEEEWEWWLDRWCPDQREWLKLQGGMCDLRPHGTGVTCDALGSGWT